MFLVVSFACSQEVELEGQILNQDEVANIHVLNTTSRFNAITNQEGRFTIYANIKDTLVISAIKYFPKKVVVTQEMYTHKKVAIVLEVLLNELDEVVLGNTLSGDLLKDVSAIKTKKDLNFDDVGIPGFKGEPEEKIPNLIGQTLTPVSVDLESLYKHISGYYKKLKMQRYWVSQDRAVAEILNLYPPSFFFEAYGIPINRAYDFVLYCIETSSVRRDFENKNFNGVLQIFKEKAATYKAR